MSRLPKPRFSISRFIYPLAAAVFVCFAALSPAKAMTPATVGGLNAAIDATNMAEQVRYVCRHRWDTSRRVCWYEPPRHRYRQHYRPYRPHHRPYRPYRPRRW